MVGESIGQLKRDVIGCYPLQFLNITLISVYHSGLKVPIRERNSLR